MAGPYDNLSQILAPRPAAKLNQTFEPNDPVELSGLQGSRERELQTQLANDIGAGDRHAAGRSQALLKFLNEDMASDPYTGDAAHAQTQKIEDQQSADAMYMSPDRTEARGQQLQEQSYLAGAPQRAASEGALQLEREKGRQQQNLLQQFAGLQRTLNGGGQPPAAPQAPSAPGKNYLDDEGNPVSAAPPAQTPVTAPPSAMSSDSHSRPEFKVGLSAAGNPTLTERPLKYPNATEQNTLDSLESSHRLMSEVRDLITQNGGPSLDKPAGGFFDQLKDVVGAKAKRELYGLGFQDPTLSNDPGKAALYDKTTQLIELAKVLATRGLQGGTRNMAWIQQIQDHVASGQMPTATQLQRLNTLIEEYPKLKDDILRHLSPPPTMTLEPQ